ncbi:sugar phosphate isomerase/epimerase [Halococcus sp. IIIV-5B]|uniref:sugar phosphate isomerase/epimerase family protein n=1 Tax=Halococcus sp. IIIV-5B TaxID=2321230 RepID=UPI000E73F3A7|nr:sugar phosphate isomerase/epimerase [Halococcus sp. IIIV-5B]RJT07893.1 sugar phosphate isomerase/epimerase [Halococcus sp. IIIV-5B]
MRIAGSSLLYSRYSFADACRWLSELGFGAVDIGVQEGWAHFDPSGLVGASDTAVAAIDDICQTTGLEPVALNANAGDVNLEIEVERVRAVIDLADELGIPVVTLPAAPAEALLSDDLDRFETLVGITEGTDVTLTVETHRNTLTEDPSVVAEYAAGVSGLGYTLDPGHYVINVDDHDGLWDGLLPNVAHVHLRQAGTGWEEIQMAVEDGDLDVISFLKSLRDAGYDEAITVEYIDSLDGVVPDIAEQQAKDLLTMLESAHSV